MRIWVDADACPAEIKTLLFRAARKREIPVILVANQPMRHPRSHYLSSVWVGQGKDKADQHILAHAEPGDLVITSDIPLAAQAVEQQLEALSPYGDLLTAHNIGERLAMRNLMDELRGEGFEGGGPPPFNQKAQQQFSNQFDRWVTAARKNH